MKLDLKCNVCGASELTCIGKAGLTENAVTSDARPCLFSFDIYCCTNCHHLQKIYSENDLKKISKVYSTYDAHYLSDGDEHFIFPSDAPPQPRTQYILNKCLTVLPKQGKLLDLGTGTGAVLKSAAKILTDWKLFAYDIDCKCEQEILKLPHVVSFTHSSLDNLPDEKFDLIVLWHTFEHVPSPVDFLIDIKPFLSDRGHVLLQVPDVIRTPYDLTVVDHCSHWTQNTLINAVNKAGYSVALDGQSWIHNCSTLLLKSSLTNDPIHSEKGSASIGSDYVKWINSNLKHFENSTKETDYVLFGSGMASVYLIGQLSRRPLAIMDEDERKSGHYVEDIQVLRPGQIPSGKKVILPFSAGMAMTIKNKLENVYREKDWKFVLPLPFKNIITA